MKKLLFVLLFVVVLFSCVSIVSGDATENITIGLVAWWNMENNVVPQWRSDK